MTIPLIINVNIYRQLFKYKETIIDRGIKSRDPRSDLTISPEQLTLILVVLYTITISTRRISVSAVNEAIDAPVAPKQGIKMQFKIKLLQVPINTQLKNALSCPKPNNICMPNKLLNPIEMIRKARICIGTMVPTKDLLKNHGTKTGEMTARPIAMGIAIRETIPHDFFIKSFILSYSAFFI